MERTEPARFGIGRWDIVRGNEAKTVFSIEIEHAEFALT